MPVPSNTDYLPHVTYDSVIFGFSGDQLKILIIEYHKTNWFALPGGFVRRGEAVNDAARRGLRERTGLKDLYLQQFYTFGDMERYHPETMARILAVNGRQVPDDHWLLDRFVSVAYYALIDYARVVLRPNALADSINWYALDELPPLLFDHHRIVERALQALRDSLGSRMVGRSLLPELFTMKDLQRVHEAILGEPQHRSSFQRRMLASGLLERREKQHSGGAHRAPYLYRFAAHPRSADG